MGPMEALTHLGRSLTPTIVDLVVATETSPLVAIHLEEDGSAKYQRLPEGATARGFPRYTRTGGNYVPRAFRDDAPYTLGLPVDPKGKNQIRRKAYAGVVEAISEAHPQSLGILALLRFLERKPRAPAWLEKLIEEKPKTQFIPFFAEFPIIDDIVDDLRKTDPYYPQRSRDLPDQPDVVTGKKGPPTRMRPSRVLGLGASSGVTLMSVDDETTGCHGWRGKFAFLQVPITETTAHHHARGLQYLVDHGHRLTVVQGSGADKDGGIQYFFWTRSGDKGAPALFRDALHEGLPLEDLEARCRSLLDSEDDLCVLGVREGRRAQYVAWHYLPVGEAIENLLRYGRKFCRPDGEVLTIQQATRACVPIHLVVEDNSINYKDFDGFALRWCSPTVRYALLDHVIEGAPFPQSLRHRVQAAAASVSFDHANSGIRRHFEIQQALLLE